ncbi:MAG: hypothetical protein V4739_13065 [Pseudomonadota bacterium]
MSRLAQLQQIAEVRERKAIRECQARHQAQAAAARERLEAVAVVTQLKHRREDMLANVWRSGAPVTGHDVQTAIRCADHLAVQEKTAQKEVQQAQTRETEATARWNEARAVQAAALRTTHKLDHAADVAAGNARRALERQVATRRDDDGPTPVPTRSAW